MDPRTVIFEQRLESVRAQSRRSQPGSRVMERVLDLLQAIAVTHKATVLTLDELVRKLGPDLPGMDRAEIRRQCQLAETAEELHGARHVALFFGVDGKVRLIDGSVPTDQTEAQAFMTASAQTEGQVCAFCLLDDPGELRGMGRRWIHAQCHPFYVIWHRVSVRQKSRKPAWEVLGLSGPNAARIDVERAYRRKSQRLHPDKGGSDEAMAELNMARDEELNSEAARTS